MHMRSFHQYYVIDFIQKIIGTKSVNVTEVFSVMVLLSVKKKNGHTYYIDISNCHYFQPQSIYLYKIYFKFDSIKIVNI